MSDNQQRARQCLEDMPMGYEDDAVDFLASYLDAAEARGWAEVAAEVERLANECEAEHKREVDAFAWGVRKVADRLRALLAEPACPLCSHPRHDSHYAHRNPGGLGCPCAKSPQPFIADDTARTTSSRARREQP